MELFLLYLWLKLDAVGVLLIFSLIASIIFLFISSHHCAEAQWNLTNYRSLYDPTTQETRLSLWKPLRKKAVIYSLGLAALLAVFPSSKDVAVLVGAHLALDVVRSPEGAKVATLLRGKANEILDAELQNLLPKK